MHKKLFDPFERLNENHHHLDIALIDSCQHQVASSDLSLFQVAKFLFVIVITHPDRLVCIVMDLAENDKYDKLLYINISFSLPESNTVMEEVQVNLKYFIVEFYFRNEMIV